MSFLTDFLSTPVTIDVNTVLVIFITALLFGSILNIIAYAQSHWTTSGSISLEIDRLNQLDFIISLMADFEEKHRALFPDLLGKLRVVKEKRLRYLILMTYQRRRFEASWFLYFRSQEARDLLARDYEKIKALNDGVDAASTEITTWISANLSQPVIAAKPITPVQPT